MMVRRIIYPLLGAAALSSCDHKNLENLYLNMVDVELVYDWRDSPGANPKSMAARFYSLKGESEPILVEFNNRTGGKVKLPAGEYRMITHNSDDNRVPVIDHNQYSTVALSSFPGGLFDHLGYNGYNTSLGQRVMSPIGHSWGCTVNDIEVRADGVKYSSRMTKTSATTPRRAATPSRLIPNPSHVHTPLRFTALTEAKKSENSRGR